MGKSVKQFVYLATSMQQANIERENFLNKNNHAILGTKFLTEKVFINKLWRLAGCSCLKEVEPAHAYAIICKVFKKQDVKPIFSKIQQVYQLITKVGVLLCSDEITTKKLSVKENQLIKIAREYYELLTEQGFLDISQKYFNIDKNFFRKFNYEFKFLSGAVPSICFEEFCRQNDFKFEVQNEEKIAKPAADLKFAFPAGEYSKAKLLMKMVDAEPACKKVLVLAKEPLTLFDNFKFSAKQKKYKLRVSDSMSFSKTDFGKAVFGVFNYLHFDNTLDNTLDYLYAFLSSRFSGLSIKQAMYLDKDLRSNRKNMSRNIQDITYVMSDKSHIFRILTHIFNSSEFSNASLDVLHNFVSQMDFSAIYRQLQHNAIDIFYEFIKTFSNYGINLEIAMKILDNKVIDLNYELVSEEPCKEISIYSLYYAGNFRDGSFDQCIICNLNSNDYPMTQRESSIDFMLKEKIGLDYFQNYQECLRNCFAKALKIPSKSLVLERALNNEDSDELYPASILEELISLYTVADDRLKDLVKPYYLPKNLVKKNVFNLGEENLTENISKTLNALDILENLENSKNFDFVLPGHLSASAIEHYVDCPFKYYIQHVLGVRSIEAHLGAKEKGSFAHKVLEAFYSKLPSVLGISKPCKEKLENCKQYLVSVFDSMLEKDKELFALSYFEDKEIEQLKQNIINMLDLEADFLTDMKPKYFEYKISPNDSNFAGYPMQGKIDRIDVSKNGHTAIIDYKGSIGNSYAIFGNGRVFPQKLQTLIYTKLVCDKLDIKPVASLYLGYGRSKQIAGAMMHHAFSHPLIDFSKSIFSVEKMNESINKFLPANYDPINDFIEPNSVLDVDRDLLWAYCWKKAVSFSNAKEDFQILLQAVEQYCSYFVKFWQAADFASNPSSADSCNNCVSKRFCRKSM